MKLDYFRMLFEYNCWANARVLERASELTVAEYRSVRSGVGSVRSRLTHTLGAEIVWLERFKGNSPARMLTEEEVPTFESLRTRWQKQEMAMRSFMGSLKDADLEAYVSYRTIEGKDYTNPLPHLLAHLFNHGTQTRSETAVILTELGHSPGDLDLVLYLRERKTM